MIITRSKYGRRKRLSKRQDKQTRWLTSNVHSKVEQLTSAHYCFQPRASMERSCGKFRSKFKRINQKMFSKITKSSTVAFSQNGSCCLKIEINGREVEGLLLSLRMQQSRRLSSLRPSAASASPIASFDSCVEIDSNGRSRDKTPLRRQSAFQFEKGRLEINENKLPDRVCH